jgi:raffinose/stachyose/melibiose transport system permease protein
VTTRHRIAWLFVLPAVLFYALFVLWPILHTIILSLFDPSVGAGAHFIRLAGDGRFYTALTNNVLLVILSLLIQLPIAMGLALLLTGRLPGRGLLRTVYFAPMIVSTAAIAFLWRYIYAPADLGGLINQALAGAGLGTHDWLGPTTDLFAIVVTVSWRYIGFHTVIFMAGLESIPGDVYEAAQIDGAGRWDVFRHVTVPMMRRVIAICVTLSIIGSLKYFDIFYLMSERGGTKGSADLVTTYMYRTGVDGGETGYASALAVALLVVTVIVAAPAMKLLHGKREV